LEWQDKVKNDYEIEEIGNEEFPDLLASIKENKTNEFILEEDSYGLFASNSKHDIFDSMKFAPKVEFEVNGIDGDREIVARVNEKDLKTGLGYLRLRERANDDPT